ncbi:MAG: hypothetical protein KAG97_03670 [Victivallales bacterium]|nr:hypothetical protein [Victivallales bacterium]
MGFSLLSTIWKEFDVGNLIKDKYPEAEKLFELARQAEKKKNLNKKISAISFVLFYIVLTG